MPLTEEQRRTLAARSRSLYERLSNCDTEPAPLHDAATVSSRRTRWRQVATKGDTAAFERLLLQRGITPSMLNGLLDTQPWRAGMGIPAWIDTIDAVIAMAAGEPETPEPGVADFLAPFCALARHRLVRSLAGQAYTLSGNVLQALVDSLAHGLHFVCRSALEVQPTLRHPARLTEFVLEYSVAARAMATLLDRWHSNMLELVQRLVSDSGEIEHHFLNGMPLGALTQIDSGLSDPHNGGKSVVRLHFASGLRLVYKPRSVALDLAYNGLLDWLVRNGAPHPLRTPHYLARHDYAWVEHIDHTPCKSLEELSQFCAAAGALLCMGYLLDATDLHDGNVIACGTSPVIVDLETLLQPRLAEPPTGTPQDALRKAAWLADRSVLRNGLLPALKLGADGQIADVGCLGSLFAAHSADWYSHDPAASPFSDAMRKDLASGTLDPATLANTVADGFTATYGFLMEKRQELLSPNGPLRAFQGQPVRFLLRDTSVYIKLLAPSLSALALREGVDRSIALESLYRLVQHRPGSDALTALVAEEITALESLDIPLLSTTTDSVALHLSNGESVPAVFAEPAYMAMVSRLQAFNPEDLALQLGLLHGAFAARVAGSGAAPASSAHPVPGPATAEAIAKELHRKAIMGEDGSVTWMAPVPIPGTEFFRFDMLPLNMASGLIGVAFFLAAYSRSTGDASVGMLARRAVQTVTQRLGIDADAEPISPAGLPIAGLGSMVYALHRIGGFLDDNTIGAAARRLVPRLPDLVPASLHLPGSLADGSEVCLGLLALGSHALAAQWGQLLLQRWNQMRNAEQSTAVVTAPLLALCWFRLHAVTQAAPFRSACGEALRAMELASGLGASQRVALDFALLGCHGDSVDVAPNATRLGEPVDTLQSKAAEDLDNLQAGGCSVAERLFISGRVLNRPELQSTAQHLLNDMARRASQMGGYQMVAGMPLNTFFPGFNQGLCGIGYTLLRHTSKTPLPCVQLWE